MCQSRRLAASATRGAIEIRRDQVHEPDVVDLTKVDVVRVISDQVDDRLVRDKPTVAALFGLAFRLPVRGAQLAGADAGEHPMRIHAESLRERTGGVRLLVLAQAEELGLQLNRRWRPPEPAS